MASIFLCCGIPLRAFIFLHIVDLWNLFRPMFPTLFLILPKLCFWSNFFMFYCFYVVFLWTSPLGLPLLMMLRCVDFHASSLHTKFFNDLVMGACKSDKLNCLSTLKDFLDEIGGDNEYNFLILYHEMYYWKIHVSHWTNIFQMANAGFCKILLS